jgi:hypothetical protein
MWFDSKYQRPSDNPVRVAAYAVGACAAVYTVLGALSALAGNYDPGNYSHLGGAFGGGVSPDRSAVAASRWPIGDRDATSNVYGGYSYNRYGNDTITSGNGWGATGLAGGGCCAGDRLGVGGMGGVGPGTSNGSMDPGSRGSGVTAW